MLMLVLPVFSGCCIQVSRNPRPYTQPGRLAIAFVLAVLTWTSLQSYGYSQGAQLKDPSLATVNKQGSPWSPAESKEPGQPGLVETAAGREDKPGVHLRSVEGSYKSAAIQQKVTLAAGLYELTVWAKGSGNLLLKIPNNAERSQPLRKDWNLYGFLFEWAGGEAAPIIGIFGDGFVSEANLLPATDEQKAAWAKQREALRQFGFVTNSAQRPVPGGEKPAPVGEVKPLNAMTDRVVFWDDRFDSVGQAQHQDRLVKWLVANSFKQLKSEELAQWMKDHIKNNDAYGSVTVQTMGYEPADLSEKIDGDFLWVRYLKAGGRIVSVGDLPFNYFEYPDARPLPQGIGAASYGALGLEGGWNLPYWGRDLPVTQTQQAKDWGFETGDASVTGFAVESISIPFGTYVVPESGKLGASWWLKNVRPDMPWSGLIKMCQGFDGRNDAQLRDVWRAANYVGKPMQVPEMPAAWQPPKDPDVMVKMTASGIAGRTEFVRGETMTAVVTVSDVLNATNVLMVLLRDGKAIEASEQLLTKGEQEGRSSATFILNTAPYTYGTYTLKFSAYTGGKPGEKMMYGVKHIYAGGLADLFKQWKLVGEATQLIGIRYVPPEGFNWEPWVGTAPNPYRRDMTFEDIKKAGMEPHLTDGSVEGMDAILRLNMGFSRRLDPDLTGGKTYTWEKNPEFFRLNLERKPIPSAYAGGRPTLGISQPEIRENLRQGMFKALKPVADHPGFRPYVLTNDDFQIYYGWDFSPHVVQQFKDKTGLDAPTKMVTPPFGVVDENNSWLRWFEFTLKDIDGAANRAETQGITEARSDCRIGPIPGGMQIPLILMWEPSQYPPLNFGKNGFNLLCFYYYNTYWQPVMTNTYWMEIGRMTNRNLPEWCMPDLFMTAGYQRNNLFHLLAGGAKGLAYFTYDSRNPGTWEEVKHLAPQVRRVSPVQARLQPAAKKDLGLLVSFTTNCFDAGHDLILVYAYENLMQAHFDVEMTCEEEVLSGDINRYKNILLYNVRWLRQSVYDALQKYIAKGGTVLIDNTIPFDIPGAKRVNIDTGMGKQHTTGVPPEGAHASVPGINDYGDPDRIAVIQKALSEFVKPRFDCPDIRLVANRFEVGGVPYTWFVNAHTGKEYMFCRQRMGAGHPGSGTPEKIAELIAWEKKETSAGLFTTTATFASLPGVPYDLVAGKPVKVTKSATGFALDLSMERFGGSLVVFYPEAIDRVAVKVPVAAKPLQEVAATIQVLGKKARIAGAVPIEVTLTDPSGNINVLSGVRATDNGTLAFNWTPAVNDVKGKWTLKVEELASRKRGEASITVR